MSAAPRLDILVYTEGLPVDGQDPVDRSLGGSETAVVSMAKALRKLGHTVAVACNTEEKCRVDGVYFFPSRDLFSYLSGRDCDVFLTCRYHSVLSQPVRAHLIGMWNEDMPQQEIVAWTLPALAKSAFLLFVSRFQRDEYEKVIPGISRFSLVTSNGIDFDAVDEVAAAAPPRDRSRLRFLYASRPERGLDFLLDRIWPRIRQRYPQAELLVTTYVNQGADLALASFYAACDRRLRSTAGARKIGPLTRRQLWRELAECAAVLYPTSFPETNCMVALEAQALGIPIVTTDAFALRETVGCADMRVTEPWGTDEYVESFLARVARLVEDEAFDAAVRRAGKDHVRRDTCSWDALAAQWSTEFLRIFHERAGSRKAGILRRFLQLSDLAAARCLVHSEPDPENVFDPADLADLRQRLAAAPRAGRPEPSHGPRLLAEVRRNVDRLLPGPETEVRLLEIGGTAVPLLLPLLAERPGWRLTVVLGQEAAAAAIEAHPQIEIAVCPGLHEGRVAGLPRGDLVVIGELLQCVEDPPALLEGAERLAARGVVGALRRGPWEDGGLRLHGFTHPDLRSLLRKKAAAQVYHALENESKRGEPLGWWVFSYQVDERNRPGGLDLARKLLVTPSVPKVSATILVRNEELHLRSCIESFAEVVDEIILGDTGSTDSTLEIAAALGFQQPGGEDVQPGILRRRRVAIDFQDFSQARNELARHATGEYIFWQDADEVLVNPQGLRKWIDANLFFDGFCWQQRQVMVDAPPDSQMPIRCFRPQTLEGMLSWFGCIHEVIENGPNRVPGKILPVQDVYLAHTGYLQESLRRKKTMDRNFPLLIKDRRENPDRHLGYILGMREYLNLAVWEIDKAGHVMTRKAYRCLNYGLEIWEKHGPALDPAYREIAFEISQSLLEILWQYRLPLRRSGKVPFAAEISLGGGFLGGPLGKVERKMFFSSARELEDLVRESLKSLRDHLDGPALATPEPVDIDSAPQWKHLDLPAALFGLRD